MPKPKPDQVVRHEFVLGKVEREQVDTLVTGLTMRNVLGGAASIMGNPYALAATVGLLEAFGLVGIRQYIKDNTPLDEWYKALKAGIYETQDLAMDALTKIEETAKEVEEFTDDPSGAILGGIKARLAAYFHFQPNGVSPQQMQALASIYGTQADPTQPAYPGMGGSYY